MGVYERADPDGYRVIDRWAGGVGWLAHPEEPGRRASHAVRGDGGVWLLDPLDAPGVAGAYADLGDVAGVVVCSSYHARDADAFARRHDVPVYVPSWMERVEERVDAAVERFDGSVAGFEVLRHEPMFDWTEAILFRSGDGTLYVPDAMAAGNGTPVGDERVGVSLVLRPIPPRGLLADVRPDRILFGHSEGVFTDAAAALDEALAGARRRLPRALWELNLRVQLRTIVDAVRD